MKGVCFLWWSFDEWYMLNVNCWLRMYTCLMLIFGCGDCMNWIMLLNSYMQFDDDNCGACIYERCLFFVMIIWWMIGDKHVYVMLFVEHVKCWLLMVNPYMLILIVILLVNACMQNEGDIWYYIQCWWVYCWIYIFWCWVIYSCIHGWCWWILYVWWCWWILYPWGDVDDVFLALWVDDIVVVNGTVSM